MSRCFGDEPYDDRPWERPIYCANQDCDQQAEQDGWLCPGCERTDAAQAERERQQRLREDAFRRGVA